MISEIHMQMVSQFFTWFYVKVGSFVAEEDAKYMTCGRGIHNSLTHRKITRLSVQKVNARCSVGQKNYIE